MIVTATHKNIGVTPRKMRMAVEAVKGLKPQEAVDQLAFFNKSSAQPLMKAIKQAIANAKNNHKLDPETLRFHQLIVSKGMTMKRFHAGARGMARPFKRVRTHLVVQLISPEAVAPKVVKKQEKPVITKKAEAPKAEAKKTIKKVAPKKATKKETK